jgi:UDP-GlcNAc:undecaprenyl-phosphate/decaprenyl-phosphate GlcNAc-1-phosphate transferase
VLFLAFVVALAITAALIPFLARWAPVIGLTDAPGPRKVHSVPVPRVGGLAMGIGLLVPTLVTVELTRAALGLLAGILVLLLFGLWDDRKNLGYRTKLAGQVIAVGLCMFIGGIRIGALYFRGVEIFPDTVSTLLTFAFLVGVTNAVNLADGLDGLAGGLVLLCLCAIALFAASAGNTLVTTVALIEAGAILGFLRFNTHPARIFMGDSGSQVLGFSVGALAVLATHGESSGLSSALPLLLLGLPIVDTLTVMLTRIHAGRSPFSADSNHLHHRLLNLGFAHREAVLLIYVAQVALVLLAYFLRFESDGMVVLSFCVFAALVLGFLRWASYSGWRLRERGGGSSSTPRSSDVQQSRLPSLTLAVITTCLLVYGATVVLTTRRVGVDVGVLCLTMLIFLTVLSSWKARGPAQWFERAFAYISVVTLVYLDQTAPDKPPLMTALSWTLIAVTGLAAIARFSLSPTRRFEVTTLDLLVVFIALVVPNLPGAIAMPVDLPAGIAKAVILMYVVEMLLTTDLKRLLPRLILMLMLAVIAGRALLGMTA